jgi:hypothetical protein
MRPKKKKVSKKKEPTREMKEWHIFTCEHRRYTVKAYTRREAEEYIKEADLSPKDSRVVASAHYKLDGFGDFKIL